MTGYIVGMTFGGIFLLIGIIFLLLINHKKIAEKKLIKKLGTKAEVLINSDIKFWSKRTNNKFIQASLYSYDSNKVFEVDSILITNKALIVIEIKSIKGGVEGRAENPKWEKVLGDARHYITNPIIQNDKHIEHIIKMLGVKIPTISLIVFSNRTQYLKIENKPSHVLITRQADLFDTLDEINKSLQVIMNEDQVKDIYMRIKQHMTTNRKDEKLHYEITRGKRG